jgi:hypothetical protein
VATVHAGHGYDMFSSTSRFHWPSSTPTTQTNVYPGTLQCLILHSTPDPPYTSCTLAYQACWQMNTKNNSKYQDANKNEKPISAQYLWDEAPEPAGDIWAATHHLRRRFEPPNLLY